MKPSNIDHDTFQPLDEMEADATFVEVIEQLNDIVAVVNALVVMVNGTHDIPKPDQS